MAPLLERLSREPAKGNGTEEMSKNNKEIEEGRKLSSITCPECSGSLTESDEGGLLRFCCHVGHAFTAEGMIAEQAEALEAALWTAVRTLEESEMLARRMASRSEPRMASRFTEKAEAMKQHAAVIRNVLLSGEGIHLPDATTPTRRSVAGRMS